MIHNNKDIVSAAKCLRKMFEEVVYNLTLCRNFYENAFKNPENSFSLTWTHRIFCCGWIAARMAIGQVSWWNVTTMEWEYDILGTIGKPNRMYHFYWRKTGQWVNSRFKSHIRSPTSGKFLVCHFFSLGSEKLYRKCSNHVRLFQLCQSRINIRAQQAWWIHSVDDTSRNGTTAYTY